MIGVSVPAPGNGRSRTVLSTRSIGCVHGAAASAAACARRALVWVVAPGVREPGERAEIIDMGSTNAAATEPFRIGVPQRVTPSATAVMPSSAARSTRFVTVGRSAAGME